MTASNDAIMGSGGGQRLLDKVHVADRGEMACRVIQACSEQGIPPVAVHSGADSGKPRARMVDEATPWVREALAGTVPYDLEQNIPLHQRVLAHPAFRAGELSTSLTDEHIVPGS